MIFKNYKKNKAQKLHDKASALSDDGHEEKALELYFKAIELDSTRSTTFYNIGLIYKYWLMWEESFQFNMKANELDPEDEAACWNLAIAATALGRWDVARSKWKEYGIKIDEGVGPINMDFGLIPVRLNPDDSGEVVWAIRIDPARAIIESVPFPESRFKYRDTVLHDGAPVGHRILNGEEVPVFNVLELFESSDYHTLVAEVEVSKDKELEALKELFSSTDNVFEDWTMNTRTLCKQCSEGTPHEHHDKELKKEWSGKRTLGIACKDTESVSMILDEWQKKTSAQLIELYYDDE